MATGRLKIDIRRNKILELLAQNGQVTVAELSGLLNATQTTIRTDLDTMAAENRLMRIPGGAIAVPAQPVQPPVQEAAPDALAAQKRAIAAKTLSHIQDGDTLFLNSGSTTLRVAEALCVRKRLCVVTNSIRAAEVLAGYPETHVVLLGGEINAIYGFTFGDDAVQQLGRYQPAMGDFVCRRCERCAGHHDLSRGGSHGQPGHVPAGAPDNYRCRPPQDRTRRLHRHLPSG